MALWPRVRQNLAYMVFVATLVGLSSFFTYHVEVFRGDLAGARITAPIASGAEVRVIDVIDGDEIAVQASGGDRFVVRLLGIKSFNAVANDPSIGVFGRGAVIYLEARLQGEPALLEFDEFAKDTSGRLLAYVRKGGDDVGKVLVARGLSLVYVAYPFSRDPAYRLAQAEARDARAGLWGTPRAARRAQALIESWEAGRDE